LRIPLISNDKSVTTFNATTCWYNSFDWCIRFETTNSSQNE
jgi:hypothetical protein